MELLVAEEEVRSRKQEYYGRRWDWTKARITRRRIRTSPELLMSWKRGVRARPAYSLSVHLTRAHPPKRGTRRG